MGLDSHALSLMNSLGRFRVCSETYYCNLICIELYIYFVEKYVVKGDILVKLSSAL